MKFINALLSVKKSKLDKKNNNPNFHRIWEMNMLEAAVKWNY